MKKLTGMLIALAALLPARAQPVASFTLTDPGTGKAVSLQDFWDKKAVVLIFYDARCPYTTRYRERLNRLAAEFGREGIVFLLIGSSPAARSPSGWSLRYLADPARQARQALGAARVPEVFVLQPARESFRLAYSGAIDDNPQSAGDVHHAYLREALVNLLKNKKPDPARTRPSGCLIK